MSDNLYALATMLTPDGIQEEVELGDYTDEEYAKISDMSEEELQRAIESVNPDFNWDDSSVAEEVMGEIDRGHREVIDHILGRPWSS